MEWWKSWLNRQDFKYSSVQRLSNLESYCAAAGWLTSVYCGWCVCAKLIISWQWIWREADSRNNNITIITLQLHTWTPEHGKTGLYPNHLHIGHTVSYFQPGSEVDCPQLGLAPLAALAVITHTFHNSTFGAFIVAMRIQCQVRTENLHCTTFYECNFKHWPDACMVFSAFQQPYVIGDVW